MAARRPSLPPGRTRSAGTRFPAAVSFSRPAPLGFPRRGGREGGEQTRTFPEQPQRRQQSPRLRRACRGRRGRGREEAAAGRSRGTGRARRCCSAGAASGLERPFRAPARRGRPRCLPSARGWRVFDAVIKTLAA